MYSEDVLAGLVANLLLENWRAAVPDHATVSGVSLSTILDICDALLIVSLSPIRFQHDVTPGE